MLSNRTSFASAPWAIVYTTIIIALFVAQLIMHGDPLVAFSLSAASALALLGAVKVEKTAAEILLWVLSFYLGFGALLLKTMSGQVVQSNLNVPDQAAFGLIAATASIGAAYKLADLLCRGRKDSLGLGRFFSDPAAVSAISIKLSVISSALYFLHTILVGTADDPEGSGFGGFGSFYFLQNVAVAFMWAALSWNKKPRYLLMIFVLMAFALFTSVLSNQKRILIDFALVTVLCFIFIQQLRRFWPLMAMIGVAAVVVAAYIVPAIQATRLEAKHVAPWERIEIAWALLESTNFDPSRLAEVSDQQSEVYKYSFGPYLSYYYPKTSSADRFSLIFPLDQVERAGSNQKVPTSMMFSDIIYMLPGFLVTKSSEVSGDVIAWNYGIRQYGSIGRPVLGAPASAYAFGHNWGLLILPGITYFFIFVAASLIGGSLQNNPLAIALAAIISITAEYTVVSFGYFVRPLPILVVTLLALRWITYRLPSYRRLAIREAALINVELGSSTEAQTRVSKASR